MNRISSFILLFLFGCVSALSQAIDKKNAECQEEKNGNLKYEKQLKDWAQIERYRDANLKLISIKNETRVVFMGDSITDG